MNHRMKGYFCIVQYCPDLARKEVANVGVLLFVPEQGFLQLRMDSCNQRIERFFGPHRIHPDHISLMKQAFRERIEVERKNLVSLADLAGFVQTRANNILLTQPKAIRVGCPKADIESLFANLVAETHLNTTPILTA